MNEPSKIHVVAAAIEDPYRRTLVAQRPPGKHMPGYWEFPGGKLEPGEVPLQALARELREELGIEIGPGPHQPVRRISHSYTDRDVLIEVWRVRQFAGIPRGLDAQQLRWCTPDELEQVSLLPADKPIVAALRLPAIVKRELTQEYSIGIRVPHKQFGAWCSGLEEALAAQSAGADFLLLRAEIPLAEISALCRELLLPLFAMDLSLDAAWSIGASGVHTLRHCNAGASA